MRKYILMFEYDSKKFMDINKIIIFKSNLKKLEEQGKTVHMAFYGEASDEELATFMSYFNSLVGKAICNLSISLRTKEIVFENGINNKSIKLSSKNAKELQDKKFDSIINEYYSDEDVDIRILPTKDWENLILDLIGE